MLEALACGRPVLATAAGGTAELLEGLDGMLARTREPEALARGLAALLAARSAARSACAPHAARFSWDARLDALESLPAGRGACA